MEPQERELRSVIGWHVVEVGRRQAWPFIGFAHPERDEEVRLYVDCSIAVLPGARHLRQHDTETLIALDDLNGLTVEDVREGPTGVMSVVLGASVLELSNAPNELTSHNVWWLATT